MEKDFKMRAAFSHSRSSVAGQKASRCIRLLPRLIRELAFAAAVLILAKALGDAKAALPVLVRFDQPKKAGRGPVDEVEALLSHEGRKDETRCMAGRLASPSPLSSPGGGTTERTGRDGVCRCADEDEVEAEVRLLLGLALCLWKPVLTEDLEGEDGVDGVV